MIQRYRKIFLQNIEFRPSSNMMPTHVISNNAPEIVSNFDIWIWISDISSFLWSLFLRFLLEVALRLAYKRWIAATLLAIFRLFYMETQKWSRFLNVHLFWFESFHVDFRWWAWFWDLPYPLSVDHQSNFSLDHLTVGLITSVWLWNGHSAKHRGVNTQENVRE